MEERIRDLAISTPGVPESQRIPVEHEGGMFGPAGLRKKEIGLLERFRQQGLLKMFRIMLPFVLTTQACFPRSCEPDKSVSLESVRKERRGLEQIMRERDMEAFRRKLTHILGEDKLSVRLVGATVNISSGDGERISIKEMDKFRDHMYALGTGKYQKGMLEIDVEHATPNGALLDEEGKVKNSLESGFKVFKFPIHELRIQINDGRLGVEVFNWLTGKSILVTSIETPKNKNEQVLDFEAEKKRILEMWQPVVKAIKEDRTQLNEQLEALKVSEKGRRSVENSMFVVRKDGNGVEQIFSLVERGYTIDVHLTPLERRSNNLSGANELNLSPDMKNDLPDASTMEFSGTITYFELRKIYYQKDPPGTNMFFKDQFGNIIMRTVTKIKDERPIPVKEDEDEELFIEKYKNNWLEVISIMVAPASNSGVQGQSRSISFDISQLGLPKLTSVFFDKIQRSAGVVGEGKYALFINGGDGSLSVLNQEKEFEQIAIGASEVERLFGIIPGKLIRNIQIVDTEQKNGMYNKNDPYSLIVTDEHVKDRDQANREELRLTSVHEGIHLIYRALSLDDNSTLNEIFKRRSKNFFNAINESSWNPGSFGGHSGDNPTEFVASFVTSLLTDDAEHNKVLRLTDELFIEYIDTASSLRSVIVEQKELLAKIHGEQSENFNVDNLPIVKKLDAVIRLKRKR